ncbi:MAG TPA: methionyl-tRNA formyltransferase [bacterium]|nr:methionyl-tRNA formyltransferase [bacterium]
MKILYFGCDDFGIPSLEKISEKHEIVGIVTAPDKPGGRGMKICSNIVKEWALKNNVNVHQPAKLDSIFIHFLKSLRIDLILLISYGKKLPQETIEMPTLASINVHPSLLPKYRGAAPMEWALINGEKETGITVIKMTGRIDEGNILASRKVDISEKDDIFSIKEKLSLVSAEIIDRVIDDIDEKGLHEYPQKGVPCYTRKLTKDDGLIDWNLPSYRINNLIRGMKEWPGAYTFLQTPRGGKCLKIFSAERTCQNGSPGKPGEILNIGRDSIEVACGTGSLSITEVQVEGKRRNRVSEFIKGYRILPGAFFSKGRNCSDGQA